jgi:hypothetical protein
MACALVVLALGGTQERIDPVARAAAMPAATDVPFAAGTAWSYAVTSTKDGQTRTGTSTETYRGMSKYAGTSYHLVEVRYSIMPGFLQRTFLTWDGSRFRQVAMVESEGQNTAEIVFDKAIPMGAQDASTGMATVVVNGAQHGQVPWSYTSVSAGRESVRVPAGSFQAQRWDGVLKLGSIESRFTAHIVGITDVRVESSQTLNGAPIVTMVKQLSRGPIR